MLKSHSTETRHSNNSVSNNDPVEIGVEIGVGIGVGVAVVAVGLVAAVGLGVVAAEILLNTSGEASKQGVEVSGQSDSETYNTFDSE